MARNVSIEKKIKYCDIEDCDNNLLNNTINYSRQHQKMLCSKHCAQLDKYGKVQKTIFDPNEIIIYDDYAEIILYNRQAQEVARTKIDIEDIDKLKKYKWYLHSRIGYAVTKIKRNITKNLHQILIGDWCDHINHNVLDNRKSNLRKCTNKQNNHNASLSKRNTSNVVGVYWHKIRSKWCARIGDNGKYTHIGIFQNKRDATIARLKAERQYYKEFQNKILEKKNNGNV